MKQGIPIDNRGAVTQEQGFVSIFSVLIIMSILTLVLVGFSSITRQAQRRTLDDQLNTQAFYAAESGVNDAKVALAAAIAAGNNSYSKTTCDGQDLGNNFTYNFDTDLNVGYSCVLINSSPSDIRFSSVGIEGGGAAKTVTLASKSGAAITQFTVSWDSKSANDTLPTVSTPSLTPRASWGTGGTNVGMLRMDIVPVITGALDRATLVANTYTTFLYPSSNSGMTTKSLTPGPANQGSVDLVRCNATGLRCKLDFTLLAPGLSNRYILRLQAIYNDVQVDISDVKDTVNNAVTLIDGQAIVDVTGRANDVFRRIQVRLPLKPTGFTGSAAIQTADSICKLLSAGPTTTVDIPSDIPIAARGSCLIN